MRLGPTTVQHIARAYPTPENTDRYNTRRLTDADPFTVEHCRLDIGSSEEFTEDRQTIISRGTLYIPYTVPDPEGPAGATLDLTINPVDAFIVEGDLWEVDGNPKLIDSHRGPHHYEVPVIHSHN